MATVTYQGPSASVDIPLPDGSTVVAERGVAVEVPADVAKSLADQETFAPTATNTATTTSTAKVSKAQGAAKKSAPKKSEED